MAMWKKALILLIFILLAGAGYGLYLFNKKTDDIKKEKPAAQVLSTVLVRDFNMDEDAANKKYLGKVISITGKVADVKIAAGQATVFLDGGDPLTAITCSFYDDEMDAVKKLQAGAEVTIKGFCTGKLADVIINKCSIVH